MQFNEFHSDSAFRVPKESCVTMPSPRMRMFGRVEWPPSPLIIGQMVFTVVLYVLGVGLVGSVAAALMLLVGDVLAVYGRTDAVRRLVVRVLTAAGGTVPGVV